MKEKFWDIFSSKYDKITKGTNLTRDVEIEKSLKYIQSNHVALDYGCGTGTLANSIADKVQKVIAIDISSGMLEVAKKKAVEKQITNVEFLI